MKTLGSIKKALKASLDSRTSLAITLTFSIITIVLMALSSNIEYSIQMISAGFAYTALQNRFVNIYVAAGNIGMILTVIYSFLVGATVSNLYTRFRQRSGGYSSLAGVLPAFIVGGCASCGLGLLAILGFGGALAALPFQGNLVRAGGILLLVLFLARSGDPRVCEMD